jgi:hypothetical protein
LDVRRFRDDLHSLAHRACSGDGDEVKTKVLATADILVGLYRKNLVKINHSALELVCARNLIKQGYEVKVEHRLDRSLVCDVFGVKGEGTLVVEIETGFIPPEAALQPATYARGRIASKIARYSRFAGKFALGTTRSYVLDIPPFFTTPAGLRTAAEAEGIKTLTDIYYSKPPIALPELMRARVHSIFVVDVDSGTTEELDPETYLRRASGYSGHHYTAQGLYVNH